MNSVLQVLFHGFPVFSNLLDSLAPHVTNITRCHTSVLPAFLKFRHVRDLLAVEVHVALRLYVDHGNHLLNDILSGVAVVWPNFESQIEYTSL